MCVCVHIYRALSVVISGVGVMWRYCSCVLRTPETGLTLNLQRFPRHQTLRAFHSDLIKVRTHHGNRGPNHVHDTIIVFNQTIPCVCACVYITVIENDYTNN